MSTRKNINKAPFNASQPTSDDMMAKAESIGMCQVLSCSLETRFSAQFERKLSRFLHKVEGQVEEKVRILNIEYWQLIFLLLPAQVAIRRVSSTSECCTRKVARVQTELRVFGRQNTHPYGQDQGRAGNKP